MPLSDADEHLLEALLPELIGPGTVAVAAVGSFGRGNPGPESDVDITRFLVALPEDETDHYRVEYRGDRMVGVLANTLDHVRSGLSVPQRAIWTVPYLRTARALHDPEGRLAQLQEEARSFTWERLQPAANLYASHRLMKFSEEALKLALAIRVHDEQRIMTETIWLILGLPLVLAVQRGIFLENETRAPVQVQVSVGLDAPWSRQYRIAAGIGGTSNLGERGRAALRLYCLTAEMLANVLRPDHRTVIEETVRRAGSAVPETRVR